MNDLHDLRQWESRQIEAWPLARQNYEALDTVQTKAVRMDGCDFVVQFNPARIRSSAAKVDKESLAKRPCFLCAANRPAEQGSIPFLGRYQILINPYPIFRRHLTIASNEHTPQSVTGRVGDMLRLAQALDDYTVFYNGPGCGASAPDHMHFQAGSKGVMPIEGQWREQRTLLCQSDHACLWLLDDAPRHALVLQAVELQEAEQSLDAVLGLLPTTDDRTEPAINILCRYDEPCWTVFLFPRTALRPKAYYLTGDDNLLVSPASVEMGGLFITPQEKDFKKVTDKHIRETLRDVCWQPDERQLDALRQVLPAGEPQLQVGIVDGHEINFHFLNPYCLVAPEYDPQPLIGKHTITEADGHLVWNHRTYDSLTFGPQDPKLGVFELERVTIGKDFHWQQQENQQFRGCLRFLFTEQGVQAINLIPVEDYLESVISSEMSAQAPPEFLKAHAVISRSWVLAQLQHKEQETATTPHPEGLHWTQRSAHKYFDVCADDHCQRYQGITRITSDHILEAIRATRGEILTYDGAVCDARFSKCCGGAFEKFATCWDDVEVPYLQPGRDCAEQGGLPDLSDEKEAERWIRSAPKAFCHTQDQKVLQSVLNNYDQQTPDFYRWTVHYTQEELATLIRKKSGKDFGDIIDLVPLARGASGRIWKLEIVGTKHREVVGKELEIRKILSDTHLYSSAFVVDKETGASDIPQGFTLTGAGWGHGVGLCQIGAAVMSSEGYTYQEILAHYYKGASLKRIYK